METGPKRPRVAPRALDPRLEEGESSNPDHHVEETEQPNPRAPDIFLSHSGSQKPFVESLYKALQSANHTAFFDQHTLPKGLPFPDKIKEAARGCKVGVIVLSEEFLTSRWPMLELEMLILERGRDPCVLPLFYKLGPGDLKSQERLLGWRRVWEELGGENRAKQWEQSVKELRRFNGEVYREGTSTDAYIDKVVKHICTLIPCHVPYDCSTIQGQSRLAQEIATKFEHMDASQARMVGLHGVGGSGKTTLCKVMVNYYSPHYLGRSFLIEFPSHGGDMSTITSACKKALNVLTDASYVHLLDKADSFDQVVQLMRDRVGCRDVFLAIDNVGESYLDYARRVLRVGFSANSKILMTNRSEGVLKDLLMVPFRGSTSNACVAPLPAPEREEAFQIFQESFECYDLSVLVDRWEMDNVLERCRFSDNYHALALKALAKYVRRVCMDESSEEVKQHLSSILQEISYKDLADVEHVIRLSYDSLSKQKKHLFLEIYFFMFLHDNRYIRSHYADIVEGISLLHPDFLTSKTMSLINELSLDGLIQIEPVIGDGKRNIGVHDLYRELALREIASSPRFLITGITETVEKVEWEEIEVVIFKCDDRSGHRRLFDRCWRCSLFDKLQQSNCPKLKVLIAEFITIKSKVRLDTMPSLTVLELRRVELVKNEHESSLVCLERLQLANDAAMEEVGGLNCTLKDDRVKGCWILKRMPDMSSLTRLKRLQLHGKTAMQEVGGLRCTLKNVCVEGCWALKRMPDLRGLTCLERLQLVGNCAMEEVGGLSCTLKDVRVEGCGALKRMPDMRGLTCLERLQLAGNSVMEKVGGLSCTLKDVRVYGCGALKRMPDMRGLTCLERLQLVGNLAMEDVGGLSCTLKDVCIEGCEALKRMLDMRGLTCLERLQLVGNLAMEEVGGLSCTLKDVCVYRCGALKRMPDMRGLTCLERLQLVGNSAMEEVGGLSCTLKDARVEGCGALKKMPDMRGLTRLERLELVENSAMEEVGGLSCTLKDVRVYGCGALKRMPDMSSLTCLERLQLVGNSAMEEVGGLSCTLKDVRVEGCRALKRMTDMSGLTCLERLQLVRNTAMEEVGSEYLSSTLKHLDIMGCGILRSYPNLDESMHPRILKTQCAHHVRSLQKLPNLQVSLRFCHICGESTIKQMDVGFLTNLKGLIVERCEVLEEIGGLSALHRVEELRINRCASLKKLKVGGSGLKSLSVKHCNALGEITGDLKALPRLADLLLWECESLKKVGAVSSTRLEWLSLRRLRSLQDWSTLQAIVPGNSDLQDYFVKNWDPTVVDHDSDTDTDLLDWDDRVESLSEITIYTHTHSPNFEW